MLAMTYVLVAFSIPVQGLTVKQVGTRFMRTSSISAES
jgi:NhaP-type Na+/H+ or K+/H+ antiporter